MIVKVRRNVFETNSSTEHTYTFTLRDAKDVDKKREICFCDALHKAALVSWLFDECYATRRTRFMGGWIFNYYPDDHFDCQFADYGEEAVSKLNSLGVDANLPNSELAEVLSEEIMKEESKIFTTAKFSYMSKLEMKSWDEIEDNLTDSERRAIALKLALIMLYNKDDKEVMPSFLNVVDKKIDGDTYLCVQVYADNMLMTGGKLQEIFHNVAEKVCKKSIDKIVDKVGYIGFDGLLNDYYDVSVFTDELKLDLSNYISFEDSLTKFLTDDNVAVTAK